MNYLSVENLTKSFGERVLFSDLTFGIDQGQKVSIIAKNGSGKTTLLRCLMDYEQYDSGRIVYRNDIRIAFMEQTELMNEKQTILEAVFDHDLPELKLIKEYNVAMDNNDEKALEHLYQEITEMNAWDIEVKVQQILSVLKLQDTSQVVGSLSGGQKKRVALAKVLLSDADFLFLDEPTNHLDLDMIEWLESYLATSKSTILMVTHDRYFLEVVCDTIFELADKTLYKYKGNFSYYLEKKAEREALEAASQDKQMNLFRRELEWARKMPRARTVKSKSRMDRFQELRESVKRSPETQELSPEINMSRLGSKIVEFHKVKKHWGEKKVLDGWDYVFKTGEKVGLVGPNGAGKTTLLKMMTLNEEPDSGKVVVGDTVVMGYYRQNMGDLKEGQRLIEAVRDIAEFIPLTKGKTISAAQMLERFLFPKSMHFQLIESLSGGEKKRLQLLLILMKNPNFLILDEPTNDLDVFTLAALEEYLMAYPGCLIIVSHDRYFLDKLVDHLFVLDGQGNVKDILGSYQKFKDDQSAEESEKKTEQKIIENIAQTAPATKKFSFKEKYEWDQIEKRIPELEKLKSQLEEKLQTVLDQHEALMATSAELAVVIEELNTLELRWLELSEKISG